MKFLFEGSNWNQSSESGQFQANSWFSQNQIRKIGSENPGPNLNPDRNCPFPRIRILHHSESARNWPDFNICMKLVLIFNNDNLWTTFVPEAMRSLGMKIGDNFI